MAENGMVAVGLVVLVLVGLLLVNNMNYGRKSVNVMCGDINAKAKVYPQHMDMAMAMKEEDAQEKEVPMKMSSEGMKDGEDDPFYSMDKYRPKMEHGEDQPDWVKSFTSGNDKLLQQNFIDTTDQERFQVTRSVCGRRFMSRDIRRVPTVTRDPTTVNNFQLPVIDPACALSYNALHPGLDPNPC